MNQKDKIIELIVKEAKKRGDNIKRCDCGAVHIWKKGKKAKFVPMSGQPCLMIITSDKKLTSEKSAEYQH